VKETALTVFFFVIIAMALGTFYAGGYYDGLRSSSSVLREEASRAGRGRWIINHKGKIDFEWGAK
jgi:hypothetical protein